MRIFLSLVFSLFLSSSVLAENTIKTVSEAFNAHDDSGVLLTGHLIERFSRDRYLFRDNTGDIEVKIEDNIFGDLTITPETRVKISGEVDKETRKIAKIEVKRLEIAN